ncbi:hypothetical protein QN277_009956 [Acacia crassicarpa]|uniref:Protein BREAST CANCER SUSCEPTIBILITY 1 homolog n=1 Tax=Acacia crassicarpa TaxID=499986 RepID=A0AAE1IQ29_9FABA|nr:hypothetical protein QN277_009956 [Acacia crassicarpa]
MGDPTHLEQMGRELKCPICWSLLNSAVSLTCNHVFCNSCIVKSMKSGSGCPVCKVPFQRREIRAAPHMDSLVSIYKSMEVSSGVNLFVTQNVPAAQLLDGEKQCDGDTNCGEQVAGDACRNHSETKETRKRKVARKETKVSKKNSVADSVKPTFPTKKRVQVPQSPLSKTPFKNADLRPSLSEIIKEGGKEGLAASKGKPIRNEEEVALSPFFWLRDEKDGEKSTQGTVEEKLSDTPTPNLPSFSDLRDSDDENPSKATPAGDEQDKTFVDFFDSEMFEWTQRPCSPELCSSPFRMQVEDTGEADKNQVKDYVPDSLDLEENQLSAENTKFENMKEGTDLNTVTPGVASLQKNTRKRGRKATKKPQEEQTEKHGVSINGTDFVPERLSKDSHEQTWDNKPDSSNQGRTNRRSKKTRFNTTSKPTPQTARALSDISGIIVNREGKMVNDSPASPCNQEHDKDYNLKNSKKSQRKGSEKQKLDNVRNIVEDSSSIQNFNNEYAGFQSPSLSLQMDNNGKPFSSRQIEISYGRKSKSCYRELKNNKRLKGASDCISQQAHGEEIQPAERIHQNPESGALSESLKEKHRPGTDQVVLRKCETHNKKFECAFCLSSEESEASGEMVHYYKGKPVAADHEGGSKVIHSHRNCTEWAPNVYFDEDVAINLEAEISRSRRIKCSFCGLKGAALGCFEKSCRRSFHVTCAKCTSQCRWDMDNFVMLCPLHASLKLPCESTGTPNRSSKCTARERKNQRNNTAGKDEPVVQNLNARWSYKKIVLCCSALSGPDRDVVSEFERVTKVTVLKKWDASVTHVIASTDDHGACKRTLKVLLGILEGKWILNVEWIKACMQAMEPVDEERYEITVDIHGIQDGPRLGRLRVLSKQPKLFDGYKFYFMGDFMPSYKGYLQDLVTAAGGTFLHRKPLCRDQKALSPDRHPSQTFVIYSLELPDKFDPFKRETILSQRRNDAEALASSTRSKAASNTWILDSIAACRLQSLVQ